jgi:UDP-N-acetylglucosamine 4,6-dehydratase/5-epimerase
MFKSKTLLITGGTGSFGNAILKAFLNTDVKEIRIFSRDEKKQNDMRIEYNNEKLKFYLGNVRDYESIRPVMHGVDYMFHAAALKQVPSCEFYPLEAIKTNVLGTENVLNAAVEYGVKKAIVLSTDKAVYPINAMGMTKALMEKIMVAKSRMLDENKIVLCGTRYGNVIGTRGSVIPLFIKQIREGAPLTITDPNMTRFLMPLEEAINLVLYALQNAKQGDIFIQKAPACTMGDLATAVKEIFQAKNEIVIIGTRHGEKLHEALLTREERARCEDSGNYFRILPDTRDLNYNKYFSKGEQRISFEQDYTSNNTKRLNVEEIIVTLTNVDYIKDELDSYHR